MINKAQTERKQMMIGQLATALVLCIGASVSLAQEAGDRTDSTPATAKDISRAEMRREELASLEAYLRSQGVPMTKDGIQAYLRALDDSKHDRADVKKLIQQLGSDRFSEREAAEQALLKLPAIPIELLQKAIKGSDPEVAFRAQRILRNAIPPQKQTVRSTLRAIELLQLSGLTKEIFATINRFQDEQTIVLAARKAILVAVTTDDMPFLSSQIKPETIAPLRDISIQSLRQFEDAALANRFDRWSRNKSFGELTRLQSTLALADLGDRRAMTILVELMAEAQTPSIRARSQVALRNFTGKAIEYSAYADPETRQKQSQNWKNWIATKGKTSRLNFPLGSVRSNGLDGYTLLALSELDKVVLLNEAHEEIWKFECGYPVSAEKMDNGNILIVEWKKKRLIEVTPEKRIVRDIPVRCPSGARPLENGNAIISCCDRRNAIEVDPNGKIVWQLKPARHGIPQAIRLDNGNTLVAETGGNLIVAEISPDGKRVWEYVVDTQNSLDSIQSLQNGNVLISIIGSAIEVDRVTRKIVWRIDRENLRDAFRLENGNTLVLAGDRVMELDPDGRELWSKAGMSYGTVRR